MHKTYRLALAVVVCIISSQSARAENWGQWRGPALNGSTTETGLPDKLDPNSNVVWKMDMPGYGGSTPIIWENKLFLTAIDKQSQKLLAMCIDDKTGKVIWQREVGEGSAQNARGNNTATASPITDGKTVWFSYGSGELAAFDMDGKPLWERNLVKEYGPFYIKWTYSCTPVLAFGKLYVQVIRRDVPTAGPAPAGATPMDSFLLAVDPMTGKNIFKQARETKALAESKESYATPLPYEGAGRKEIIVIGGDCVTGHDAETGAELWRCRGWNAGNSQNYRCVATPVVLDKDLMICTPHPAGIIISIKPGGSGDITGTHKNWEINHTKTDVPSPMVYENDLFILDGDFKKGVTRLDPKNGQVKWNTPISSPAVFRASPTGADGKIYAINEEGKVWVLSAADGKVLSTSALATDGQARGSIVASDGKLFVRTGSTLYCFGKAQ